MCFAFRFRHFGSARLPLLGMLLLLQVPFHFFPSPSSSLKLWWPAYGEVVFDGSLPQELVEKQSDKFNHFKDAGIFYEKDEYLSVGNQLTRDDEVALPIEGERRVAPSRRSFFHSASRLFCSSEACAKAAGEIQADMNTSADPCANADEYMCGGWRKRFELPEDETGWTVTFDSISNRTRHMIKDILEGTSCTEIKAELSRTSNSRSGSSSSHSGRDSSRSSSTNSSSKPPRRFNQWDAISTCLYESCMDEDALDAKGASPLLRLLLEGKRERNLRFLLTSKFDEEAETLGDNMERKGRVLSDRLYGVLAQLKNMYFWRFFVGLNSLDPSKHQTLIFHGSGLGLPYHFYGEKHSDIQVQYRGHLAKLLELFDSALGEYSPSVKAAYLADNPNRRDFSYLERAERIYDFELELREILLSPEQSRDILKYTRRITYNELKNGSPLIDVEKILQYFFRQMDKPVGDEYEFLIEEEDYMERLARKLDSADWAVLHDYILAHTISGFASMLSKSWRDEKDRYATQRTGAQPLPRWRRCRVSPPSWIVARRYISERFDKRRKRIAVDLVEDLKKAFRKTLGQYEWMSNETRRLAYSKLEAMKEKIAFPQWLEDDYESYFRRYYGPSEQGLLMMDDYFAAKLYLGEQATKYELSKFGEPQDRTEWYMTPHRVNAYYSRSTNQIAFMAAILEDSSVYVWDENSSRAERIVMMALTYGGLGGVIGHEITHGFDDEGKEYDEDGRLHSWWSKSSEANFQKRAQCIEDQYSGYSVDLRIENIRGDLETLTLNVRGNLTLGENIADNGGIQVAWSALKLRLSEDDLSSKPLLRYGVNLTATQLFLYAWGHFWCSKDRPKSIRRRIETDPHSPKRFRTIGPLMNFRKYAEAFSCSAGTVMNPDKRCRVW